MKRRSYDMSLRSASAEEARRRIVSATVELHAEHGALGTSHAMIAKRAGVSLPTVYKYFPTRDHLVPACTAAAAEKAPLFDPETLFNGLERGPQRVRALAEALFRLHAYFEPWARWTARDAAEVPALRRILKEQDELRRGLIRAALPAGATRAQVAAADILLAAPAWRTLIADGFRQDAAARAAADAINALCRKSGGRP